MRPNRIPHRVGSNISQRGLWGRGEHVAVAVSGGLDSAVLLAVLMETRSWHGAELSVITVDHGTRPDSAAHADFVASRAEELGLRCERFTLALGAEASEAACREARYACFERTGADHIALAHHRDDQAETVLVNLVRGTGARGLAGMPWKRARYVRPLLDIPREELAIWAEARGIRWVEDPTNADPRFLRNRIRSELLPLLEDLRPGAAASIARSAGVIADELTRLGAFVSPNVENAREGS